MLLCLRVMFFHPFIEHQAWKNLGPKLPYMILKRGWWFPQSFPVSPKVSQSSLGILSVPQLPPPPSRTLQLPQRGLEGSFDGTSQTSGKTWRGMARSSGTYPWRFVAREWSAFLWEWAAWLETFWEKQCLIKFAQTGMRSHLSVKFFVRWLMYTSGPTLVWNLPIPL